jgi:hypothetical protein
MAITYVGSYTQSGLPSTSLSNPFPISTATLTGGVGGPILEGDLVIFMIFQGSNTNRSLLVNGNGWSTVGKLFAQDTYDANMVLVWKVMGPTPDASVSWTNTSGGASWTVPCIRVYRGVDKNSPLDVVASTATGQNSQIPIPPAIVPATTGAKILVAACGAVPPSGVGGPFSSSDLSNVVYSESYHGSTGYGVLALVGDADWSGGTFATGALTCPVPAQVDDSWNAMTIALRPHIETEQDPNVIPNFGVMNTGGTVFISNATYHTTVSYMFPAENQEPNSDYVMFWGGRFSAARGAIDLLVYQDTTPKAGTTIEQWGDVPLDDFHQGGFFVFTSETTPANTAFDLYYRPWSGGTQCVAKDASIRLIKLPPNSDWAESLTEESVTSSTFVEKTGASLSLSAGEYVLMATAEMTNITAGSTYDGLEIGLEVDGTVVTSVASRFAWHTSTPVWWPMMLTTKSNVTSTAKVVCRHTDSLTDIKVRNVRILAIDVSEFRSVLSSKLNTDNSGTETSYTTALSLSDSVSSGPHLVIGNIGMHSAGSAKSAYGALISGGSVLGEHLIESLGNTAPMSAPIGSIISLENYTSGSRTWTISRKAESAGTATIYANSSITVLDLTSSSGEPPIEEPSSLTTSTSFI